MTDAARRRPRLSERAPAVGWWLAAGVWAVGIWWLSSRPGGTRPAPIGLSWAFNAGHAVLFGALAGFIDLAWRGCRPWAAVVLAVGYGVVDEWHQSLTPGRTPDGFDVVTDGGGAVAVVWALAWLRSRSRRRLLFAAGGLGLALAGSLLATFA